MSTFFLFYFIWYFYFLNPDKQNVTKKIIFLKVYLFLRLIWYFIKKLPDKQKVTKKNPTVKDFAVVFKK